MLREVGKDKQLNQQQTRAMMGNEYCFFATYIRAECYHQIKDKFSAAKVVKWETLLVFLVPAEL